MGSNSTPLGTISAIIPTGSTVEKAFLYSSLWSLTGPISAPTVDFDGTTYSPGDFIGLGSYQPQPISFPNFYLGAYRTDVTSQVAGRVGGGSAAPFSLAVNSENPNANIDGEVPAIVYSNPALPESTIGFLDGFSESTGDSTTIALANPITAAALADPDFLGQMSLGIGFSTAGSQSSRVDVNGTRMTSAAGGYDDGILADGGLLTVGGIGDSDDNPADPNQSPSHPRYDDEVYSLLPFLAAGIDTIQIDTLNPSLDDNIFFLGLNITAEADINPNPIPGPGQSHQIVMIYF